MIKHLLPLFSIVIATHAVSGQQYETIYSRGLATLKLTNNLGQYIFRTDRLISGFNRGEHAFIYKLPSDSIASQWSGQGFSEEDPFEEDFVEIIIKTKSDPVDFNNFDGDNLHLECQIEVDGVAYSETALFKGYFNPKDKMITTSFRILLDLSDDNYPGYSFKGAMQGRLEILVNDAFVSLKNEL